jgi:Tol biopolymer transport system component
MRRATTIGVAAFIVLAGRAPMAGADIGPVQLVSKTPVEQAAEASETALSADGDFLAFRGSIGGRTGIFREETATGAIVPVVTGSAYVRGAPGSDASEPSISADGRYVSFTTTAPLDPAADEAPNAGGTALDSDVYVADMSTSPPTYELASARDGSSEGLAYSETGERTGAAASGRVALSADGREVAFYTRSASDLTGTVGATETPAGEIAVRNLTTKSTTLVTVERDPVTGQMTAEPVPGGVFAGHLQEGASLSADGSTVAWLSIHLVGQVPLLLDEQTVIEGDEAVAPSRNAGWYDEPLWRRIDGGPGAPTRRIVGGGDPPAPGCPTPGNLTIEACQGPFPDIAGKPEFRNVNLGWLGTPGVVGVPQLSADGQLVALIGDPTVQESDLFLVDMQEGLTRKQAIKQWTFEAPSLSDEADIKSIPLDGDIFDAAIDGDGHRVAFTTARQQFPGGVTNLTGSPLAALGLVEVYVLDLETGALQRVTHGVGGPSEPSLAPSLESGGGAVASAGAGASSVTLDGDGGLLGFSSIASNLIKGDANGASDAFIDDVAEAPGTAGQSRISPPPSFAVRKPRWQMTLTAHSLPSGRVRLVAVVPGPGSLRANASASLVVGKAAKKISKARGRSPRAGSVRLTLKLPARLRHLARSSTGLFGTSQVTFRSPLGRPLHGKVEVRFRAHRPAGHKRRRR